MKKLLCFALLFSLVLTGCSFNKTDDQKPSSNNSRNSAENTSTDSSSNNSQNTPADSKNTPADNVEKNDNSDNTAESNNDSQPSAADSNNNSDADSPSASTDIPDTDNTVQNINMVEEVKNFLLYGQSDKSSAEQLKWSPEFLNRVDIAKVYDEYLANGGAKDDVSAFANYLTLNAPILDGWQELFEQNLYDAYGYKVSRIENIGGDLYQAYVMVDGKEVPYVAINARTGYYHG